VHQQARVRIADGHYHHGDRLQPQQLDAPLAQLGRAQSQTYRSIYIIILASSVIVGGYRAGWYRTMALGW